MRITKLPVLFGVSLLALTVSEAHEAPSGWSYPIECCSGLDCAPVEKTEFLTPADSTSLPQMVLTTRIGTTIVPKTAIWRQSKDNRFHVCMKTYDKNPATNFLCVFAPPTM